MNKIKTFYRSAIKAYRTAWRWPEVYGETPMSIWTSRAIAYAVPLFIVALVFVVLIVSVGFLPALILSLMCATILVLATVRYFHTEYPIIRSYEAKESRIKEFFHGFPAHTPLPLIEHSHNVWTAYGHIDPTQFLQGIHDVVYAVTEDGAEAEYFLGRESDVELTYACFADDNWSDSLIYCVPDDPECFPVTKIEKWSDD